MRIGEGEELPVDDPLPLILESAGGTGEDFELENLSFELIDVLIEVGYSSH